MADAPQVPEKVRRLAELTPEGRVWLTTLADQIAEIERRWDIRVGAPFGKGTEAYVAQAELADGTPAALKIVLAGLDPARHEQRVLEAAQGRGYARLLRADTDANVLLMERLGPQLAALQLPKREELAAICATLAAAWGPPPPGPALIDGAVMADEMAATIEDLQARLGSPCPHRALNAALDCAQRRRRAFDPAQAVLCHGDAHQWNTLAAPGGGYRLVDPDGVFAERAFDLSISMREWPEGLPDGDVRAAGRERLALLAGLTGVEAGPIWDWSLVQLVWNGLLLAEIGQTASAELEFALADAFAD
jgi:streptomycin 6-kinase